MSPTRSERARQASQERRAQKREDVRQAILQATAEVFQEKGYEGFSLRPIAERIGYSATTIYLYFKDKDDLLSTLVEERYSRFRSMQAQAAAQHQDPIARLGALGRAYMEFGISDPVFFRGAFMQRPDILHRVIGVERLQSGGDLPRQAVQEAIDAGLLAPGDATSIAHALWAAMFGVVGLSVTIPSLCASERTAMAEVVMKTMIKGLQ